MISALTHKGALRWMGLDGAIHTPILIGFLARLIRDAGCKVFLIPDNPPVPRAPAVRRWRAGSTAQIEGLDLAPDSPQLNPDEGLKADLKPAVSRQRAISSS